MFKFNPEKELKKIQHGNRNKYIAIAFVLLVAAAIGYSHAFYQVRYSRRIIYTRVKLNRTRTQDIVVNTKLNGGSISSFPVNDGNHWYTSSSCNNGGSIRFDENLWEAFATGPGVNIDGTTSTTTCTVNFMGMNKPNAPVLYTGLVPITIEENSDDPTQPIIKVVSSSSSTWYNYDEHKWANAILVSSANYSKYNGKTGTQVAMDDILQMYVWIPRYKYRLWNAEGGTSDPQNINIVFESGTPTKSNGTKNGEWLTHPAFTFGTTELRGFWVGKFVSSGAVDAITIKPNIKSLGKKTLSAAFTAARNIDLTYASNFNLNSSQIDTHIIKNMEWGAVAYLTNSIYGRYNKDHTCIDSGCEVWINPTCSAAATTDGTTTDGYTITGCAGKTATAAAQYSKTKCTSGYTWSEGGVHASTTDNMTGIYDMSGGVWEYVMANGQSSAGAYQKGSAGTFSPVDPPEAKYYDNYAYTSTYTDSSNGHLGDATKEVFTTLSSSSGRWYTDYSRFSYKTTPWMTRGGLYTSQTKAGIFASYEANGGSYARRGFRVVLTAQ